MYRLMSSLSQQTQSKNWSECGRVMYQLVLYSVHITGFLSQPRWHYPCYNNHNPQLSRLRTSKQSKCLFIDTVSMNKKYSVNTVSTNKKYRVDTVSTNKKYHVDTLPWKILTFWKFFEFFFQNFKEALYMSMLVEPL